MPTYRFTDDVDIHYVANITCAAHAQGVEFEADDWFDAQRKAKDLAYGMIYGDEWDKAEKEATWHLDFVGNLDYEEVDPQEDEEGEDTE